MVKRKQTPDVLAEVLGGEMASTGPESTPENGAKVARPASNRQAELEPPQWEYCVVTFQDYKGWRPRFINGHELRDWMSGPVIHEYLEEMGEKGWELTAASAGDRLYGNADNHQLFFKRQRE